MAEMSDTERAWLSLGGKMISHIKGGVLIPRSLEQGKDEATSVRGARAEECGVNWRGSHGNL